eukprot:gnl/MRDRNA2_/MRDRNA2_171965_c0_seq1.p1 gnl/MRDRNA2_/MRDRNA2_171965_c0~~gnl/MRDRNA2_/MRDRNA2_171965_c0_seq1.p1  ORF type:complete len:383 (-),score=64.34 gnl/MRDRNA2_/MRDRNA2_171965_c0_seq1:14-1162(-)
MPLDPTKDVQVETGKPPYRVPSHMEFVKKVGSGAYGCVCSFENRSTGEKVAVKKITNAFDDLVDGKRILREVKLLRHFNHDNIIRILDMYPPECVDFEDIYIVTDLMETDLHRVIYSKQPLTDEHYQFFAHQILKGLKYLHSAQVVHRDLKPSNILVNKNCDLKICDFGLARGFAVQEQEDQSLTDYVVTRWYRAPEVVLLASEYTIAIDVWAVGCILCELVGRKPVFAGKDHLDQIKKIIQVVGTPQEEDLTWLPKGGSARSFLKKCPEAKKVDWSTLYPSAGSDAVNIIDAMLLFDPTKRITVPEALNHKYFEPLHDEDEADTCPTPVDWAFDNFEPTKRLLQNHVYCECAGFHPEIVDRDVASLQAVGIDELLKQVTGH